MKTKSLFFLLLSLVVGLAGCTSSGNQNKEPVKPNPRIWTWAQFNAKYSDQDIDSLIQDMASIGIGGIVVHESSDRIMKATVAAAKKYGLRLHIWMITLQSPEMKEKHPEWMSYNRLGKSLAEQPAYVGYYSFMCPILPEVKEYVRAKVERLCQFDVEAISLDYCRFVDVILPDALWKNYNLVQDHEMPEYDYGYHPEIRKSYKAKYGVDPLKLKDPAKDSNWLQFRYDLITEIAHIAGEEAHKHGKKISASPFPSPSLGRKHVRQDWDKWKLDMVFPMTYHAFYNGEENWFQACIDENKKSGVTGGIYNGLYIPSFHGDSTEVANANPQVSLESLMRTSFDQDMGVCFFMHKMLTDTEKATVKKLAKEYAVKEEEK